MPPKKKEEEIDLSTLPELKTLTALILVRGKKTRALQLLQRIYKEADKTMSKVKRSQILDHAKEKGIYVDPNSLTDKQKKDPKFMETVSTELTPEVVAKSTVSLLVANTLKARIDRKANPVKEDPHRKYDLLYHFEDTPDTKEQFEQLAKTSDGIRYILVVDPKISWASAPELPEEENADEEEDEDIKEYKQHLKKEEKTPEDLEHEKAVDARIAQVRHFRSLTNPASPFRNCVISTVEPEIDPYTEEQSVTEAVKLFFENIHKLSEEIVEFEEWRKDKQAEKIHPVKQNKPIQISQARSVMEMLDNIALAFDGPQKKVEQTDDEAILALINGFSADKQIAQSKSDHHVQNSSSDPSFIAANQSSTATALLEEEVRSNLKIPGLNRYLMPEIPTKSAQLRKLQQSQYAQFLKRNLTLQEFLRRNQLLNFEQFLKEQDEQRSYSFLDRIYEEHHDTSSLRRELQAAWELAEAQTFTKYDEASDTLYLMLSYRNNGRRLSRKVWESNWRVLPNCESWLKYFRNNENNLSNTLYYDIDYEKVGNLEEQTRAYSLVNGLTGAVIINKECTASNQKQTLLYGLKNDFAFGVQQQRFFGQDGKVRLYHQAEPSTKGYQSIIQLPTCTLRLSTSGNLILERQGHNTRLITPSGYTIVYQPLRSVILHPSGGITYSSDTYTNQLGYGLKNGHLFTSPTLKRTANNAEIIKRDDSTVIVNRLDNPEKWVRFYEGTEYQVQKGEIKIEQKDLPFVVCKSGEIDIQADGVKIQMKPAKEGYSFQINFNDGIQLAVKGSNVVVKEHNSKQSINVDVSSNRISSAFGGQELAVEHSSAHYTRKGKTVDAREEEQKYGEEDTLPSDFIQPRLFVINSDGSGVQLLSDKMVKGYLAQHESQVEKVVQKDLNGVIQSHIISKLPTKSGKGIQNELIIDLDVFDNTHQPESQKQPPQIRLRTLLKYPLLTQEDRNELNAIKAELEQWKKHNAKQENEFGHKPRDDPSTKARIQSKLLSLRIRQQQEQKVAPVALFENGKQLYVAHQNQIKRQQQKQNRERQLRSQFMKKRDTIVQQYKKFNAPREKARNEQSAAESVKGFLDHYFLTVEGKRALSEMPEWVFRPKQIKPALELDPEIKKELNNTNNLNKDDEVSEERRERYDTVEINLNPKREKEIYIKPSVFTQRDIDEERIAFESQKQAYKYHEAKRKDYNVYGQERKGKTDVPVLLRTQPISEINQKYLVTQAPLDKKVKISSMRNKLTSSASSMVEMRKEGPHSLLMKTIDKGNDINKLLERRTMMVQADLNDKLQRDVLINPVEANFGIIIEKKTYELKIDIKNEDVISQRITLKRPKSIYAKVHLNEMGPIAMGMTRKITVTLKASSQIIGKFSDEFQIVTKHEIYHIPITAQVISQGQSRNESLVLNRNVSEVQEHSRKKENASFELPRLK